MSREKFVVAAEQMEKLLDKDFAGRLQDANEAKTRLLVVDEVLQILGWAKEEYNPEEKTSVGGYTDYLLTIGGQPRLIVEAKRYGIVDPLPVNLHRPEYYNSSLFKNCAERR